MANVLIYLGFFVVGFAVGALVCHMVLKINRLTMTSLNDRRPY